MTAQQHTIVIIVVWIASMGALTVTVINRLFLAAEVVLVLSALLIAAAVTSTYFITRTARFTA
jgi:hypothetical protein